MPLVDWIKIRPFLKQHFKVENFGVEQNMLNSIERSQTLLVRNKKLMPGHLYLSRHIFSFPFYTTFHQQTAAAQIFSFCLDKLQSLDYLYASHRQQQNKKTKSSKHDGMGTSEKERERERCSFQLSFDVFRHNFFLRSTISNCMHRHMKHRENGKRRRMSNVELHVEQYTRSARAGKCATVTVLTATIMSRSRIKMAKTLFIFKKHYTSMHKHWA